MKTRSADSNKLLDGSEPTSLNTLLYQDSFQIEHFEVLEPSFPPKQYLGMEFEKTTVKFRICTPKYPFVLSFILKKAL